jgi:hypothetical protein
MDAFFHFMAVLVECVAGLVALALVMLVIVWRMPNSPLKEIIGAITNRVGATAAIALIGLPIQPIPEIDGLYDITGLIILGFYWYGLIAKIRSVRSMEEARPHISEAARTLGQMAGQVRNLKR